MLKLKIADQQNGIPRRGSFEENPITIYGMEKQSKTEGHNIGIQRMNRLKSMEQVSKTNSNTSIRKNSATYMT